MGYQLTSSPLVDSLCVCENLNETSMPKGKKSKGRKKAGAMMTRIKQLEHEVKLTSGGLASKVRYITGLPTLKPVPPLYRKVRIQNLDGSNPFTIGISSVQHVLGAYGIQDGNGWYMNVVSATLYTAFSADSVEFNDSESVRSIGAAAVRWGMDLPSTIDTTIDYSKQTNWSPVCAVNGAAGKRGSVHWNWATRDQGVQYECTAGDVPIVNTPLLMSATLQASATNLGSEFRKDVYLDVTVCLRYTSNIAPGVDLSWLSEIPELPAMQHDPLASPFEQIQLDSGPHSWGP